MSPSSDIEPSQPLLRIVRGTPTDAELAVVTALMLSLGGTHVESEPARSRWNAPARSLRQPMMPGPCGWRASAQPR